MSIYHGAGSYSLASRLASRTSERGVSACSHALNEFSCRSGPCEAHPLPGPKRHEFRSVLLLRRGAHLPGQGVLDREGCDLPLAGVNLDEEAADLLRYQQAYQAAAQVISTADSMFQTLLGAVRR